MRVHNPELSALDAASLDQPLDPQSPEAKRLEEAINNLALIQRQGLVAMGHLMLKHRYDLFQPPAA